MPPQWQNMSPPENRGIEALMGLMNAVDLAPSVLRDLVGGEGFDSFDQIMTPFSSENRMSGRDVLREYNLAGDEDTWGNFGGGLLAEMVLDPVNLASMGGYGALKHVGRGLMAANKESRLLRKLGAMPEEVFNKPRSYRMGREGAYLNEDPGYRGEGKWNRAGMGEHESGIMDDLSDALDDHDEFGDLFSSIENMRGLAGSNEIPRSVTESKLLELMDDASDLGIDPGKMQINKDLILASNKGLRRPNLHGMIQDLEDLALKRVRGKYGDIEGARLGMEDAIRAFPEEKMQRVLVDAQNPFSTSGEMSIEEVNEIFRDLPGGRQVERVGESFAHDDPATQLEAFIDRASGAEDIGMIDEGQFDLLSGADDALSEIGPDKALHEMSKAEFAALPRPKLLDKDTLSINKVEVIQNPTKTDISDLIRGGSGHNRISHTKDANGNWWFWRADSAVHGDIEPFIKELIGREVGKNIKPLTHREAVQNAIRNGLSVPKKVQDEYPELAEFFPAGRGAAYLPSEMGDKMAGMGLDVSDLYTPQVDSGISGQVDAMRRLMAQNDVMRTGKITGEDVLRSLQRALGPRGGELEDMPIVDLIGSLRSLDKGGGQHDVLRWLGDKGYDALFSRRGADEFVSPLSRGGHDPFEVMQGMLTKGDDYITRSGAPETGTELTNLLEDIHQFIDSGGGTDPGSGDFGLLESLGMANPRSMARMFAKDLGGMTDMDLSDMLAQMNPGKGPEVYKYPHIAPELRREIPKALPEVLLAALLARNAGKHGLVSAGRQGFVGDQGGG